jgi:hypothetical protein
LNDGNRGRNELWPDLNEPLSRTESMPPAVPDLNEEYPKVDM